jgi:PE family
LGQLTGRQQFDTQLRRDPYAIDEDLNREDKGGHMSFVTTQPGLLTEAAGNLTGIGSAMDAENSAAAAPTTGVIPAAADEVSALTAAQFAAHAQLYQAMSAQAAVIHEMFVNTLLTSAGSYAATEAANAVAAT